VKQLYFKKESSESGSNGNVTMEDHQGNKMLAESGEGAFATYNFGTHKSLGTLSEGKA
jgi:hypothetical protein